MSNTMTIYCHTLFYSASWVSAVSLCTCRQHMVQIIYYDIVATLCSYLRKDLHLLYLILVWCC